MNTVSKRRSPSFFGSLLPFIVVVLSLLISLAALSEAHNQPALPTFFQVNTPYGEVLDCTSDGVGSITCDYAQESNN